MKVLESFGGPVSKDPLGWLPLLEPAFDRGDLPTPTVGLPAYFASAGSEWAELLLLDQFGDLEPRLPMEGYDSLHPEPSESRVLLV